MQQQEIYILKHVSVYVVSPQPQEYFFLSILFLSNVLRRGLQDYVFYLIKHILLDYSFRLFVAFKQTSFDGCCMMSLYSCGMCQTVTSLNMLNSLR